MCLQKPLDRGVTQLKELTSILIHIRMLIIWLKGSTPFLKLITHCNDIHIILQILTGFWDSQRIGIPLFAKIPSWYFVAGISHCLEIYWKLKLYMWCIFCDLRRRILISCEICSQYELKLENIEQRSQKAFTIQTCCRFNKNP